MFVRLLGTVTVSDETREVRLVSGRARALLALLAWRHGQFVSDETLIDGIWGDKLPAEPVDALYTCTKRLRRSLRDIGADELVRRRHGGYVLETEGVGVDLTEFRKQIVSARAAADAGRIEEALKLVGEANVLWAGTPLAEVSGDWAERVRRSLRREQLAAQLLRVEVGLSLRQHAELAPLLWDLITEHPDDEMTAAYLMIALAGTGRQTEALAAYQRTRDRLVREVGVEPGPRLRRLHELLLQGSSLVGEVPTDAARALAPCRAKS